MNLPSWIAMGLVSVVLMSICAIPPAYMTDSDSASIYLGVTIPLTAAIYAFLLHVVILWPLQTATRGLVNSSVTKQRFLMKEVNSWSRATSELNVQRSAMNVAVNKFSEMVTSNNKTPPLPQPAQLAADPSVNPIEMHLRTQKDEDTGLVFQSFPCTPMEYDE